MAPSAGYYDLYVVLDIFSRFVVAWSIAACEDSEIAKTMLEHAMGVHGIPEAVHANRGTSMTPKDVQAAVELGSAAWIGDTRPPGGARVTHFAAKRPTPDWLCGHKGSLSG